MRSQELRRLSPEIDPLKLSMDWTVQDLEKPQILVEDAWGDSLPGSYHLLNLSQMASKGIYSKGGKPALFHVTDMCDGIAQGWEGMNYSLLSRDMICNMIEVHWKTQPMDAIVLLSSCDKAIPGQLMAAARISEAPAIHMPGGTMMEGPGMFTLERVGTIYAEFKRGEISKGDYRFLQRNACPTVGSCSFMGTANTMQSMSEALGMALPGSAVMPAYKKDIGHMSEAAGMRIMKMLEERLTTRDILTKKAFENAIMVHAALGGSTNAILHIPSIAKEAGINIKPSLWDEINREIPFLLNIRPSGKYPAILFWYAGGVQGIIAQIKEYLHLDSMTVTGKTLGENLKELEEQRYFDKIRIYLDNYKVRAEEVIASANDPLGSGALAILQGNLAPGCAVIKHSAVPKEMFHHTGPAVIFEDERSAFDAIVGGVIEKGSVIVIRNVGPKGCGMPEMFYPTEALASSEDLNTTTALVTDGRFSGASRGPCVGYVSPEAAEGGPIAVVENGDMIEIDIKGRGLNIVGVKEREEDPDTVVGIIRDRLSGWEPPERKYGGVLGLYTSLATSAMEGGYMKY
ncbi:dihydroxy-acid dehydratase [Methanooceanicella nereidis]|nr:dihydroxy-acid dehydratase [Methanocella sp. CWC-04]